MTVLSESYREALLTIEDFARDQFDILKSHKLISPAQKFNFLLPDMTKFVIKQVEANALTDSDVAGIFCMMNKYLV